MVCRYVSLTRSRVDPRHPCSKVPRRLVAACSDNLSSGREEEEVCVEEKTMWERSPSHAITWRVSSTFPPASSVFVFVFVSTSNIVSVFVFEFVSLSLSMFMFMSMSVFISVFVSMLVFVFVCRRVRRGRVLQACSNSEEVEDVGLA